MAEKREVIIGINLDAANAVKQAASLEARIVKLTEVVSTTRKQISEQNKVTEAAAMKATSLDAAVARLVARYGEESVVVQRAKQLQAAARAEYEKQQATLNRVSAEQVSYKNTLKEARAEQVRMNKEAAVLPGSLNAQRIALSSLKKEIGAFSVGISGTAEDLDELRRKALQLNESIKEQEAAVGDFQRNVGDYRNAITKAFDESLTAALGMEEGVSASLTRIGDAIKKVSAGTLVLFAGQAIISAVSSLAAYQQELEKTRNQVRLLTDATGDLLNEQVALAQSISTTFNVDTGEVITATNALAKQLGVSFAEAGDIITKGFASGANASGDFLNQLREYPGQLKAVGLNAEQSVAIITQTVQEGIFSDKGIDTIKEAGLRLRELTPATRDALEGIGLSSKEIEQSIRDGSLSVFDVIQQVGNRLGELPDNAVEVGTAIADIFGGPGEDAGLGYIRLLGQIETDLDKVVDAGGEVTQRNIKLAETNKQIALSINEIGEVFEGTLSAVNISFRSVVADGLKLFVDTLKAIPELIRENKVELIALGAALVAFNGAAILAAANTLRLAVAQKAAGLATRALAVAQGALNVVMNLNPISLIIAALAGLVIGITQAYKRFETFRAVVQGTFKAVRAIVADFAESIKSAFLGISNILIGAFTFDIAKIRQGLTQLEVGVKERAAQVGKSAAKAYQYGYDAQRDKDQAAKLKELRSAQDEFEASEEGGKRAGEAAAKGLASGFVNGVKDRLSVAAINAELTDLKTAFENATTDAERAQIAGEISTLEARVAALSAPLDKAKKATEETDNSEQIRKETIQRQIEVAESVKTVTLEEERKKAEAVKELRRSLLIVEEAEEIASLKKSQMASKLSEEEKQRQVQEVVNLYNARRILLETETVRQIQEIGIKEILEAKRQEQATLEQTFAAKRATLAEQRSTELIDEATYRTQLQELERQHKEQLLLLQKETLQIELETELLGEQQRLEALTELAMIEAELEESKAASVEEAEKRKQTARGESDAKEKERVEAEQKLQEKREQIDQNVIESAMLVTQTIIESTEEQSAAQKAALVVQKALSIASVILDTQKRISAAGLVALDMVKLLAPIIGPAVIPIATGYRISETILAVAQGAQRIAQISGIQFANGGPLDMLGKRIAEYGGLASGPSHEQGGIQGTVQGTPIEFEGGEYIVRKESTAKNLGIIDTINKDAGRSKFDLVKRYDEGGTVTERERVERYKEGGTVTERERVERYAMGGSLSTYLARNNYNRSSLGITKVIRTPAAKYATGGMTQPVAAAMVSEAVTAQQMSEAFRAAVEGMPQPVVSVVEIADVGRKVSVKEGRGRI